MRSQKTEVIVKETHIGYKISDTFRNFENSLYDELKNIEENERIKEEIRILYVALTRAKKRIFYLGNNYSPLSWRKVIEKRV